MPRLFRALAALALVAVFAGCDSSSPEGPPPTIAPAAFSVSAFPGAASASGASADASARVGSHFLNAAGRVAIVSAAVGVHLILPEAATRAATAVEPTAAGETWLWDTTVDVRGTPVEIRLEATARGSETDWRLSTAANGGERFTYYTATTSDEGKAGTWRLFLPNEDGVVLQAAFDVRDESGREVTFSVPEGRPLGGSSVRYGTEGTARSFDWREEPSGAQTVVRWDAETRAGSIEAETYNGGARACWDAGLDNVDC